MTILRIKNATTIALSLIFLSMPLILSQSRNPIPILSVLLLIAVMAFLLEYYITFSIMKHTDSLDPIYTTLKYFLPCATVLLLFSCAIMVCSDLYYLENFTASSFFICSCPLFTIILNSNTYIGKHYLHLKSTYINLDEIQHCNKIVPDVTWPKTDLSYHITMNNGKVYKMNLQQNKLEKGMESILDEKLLVNKTESIL